MSHPWFDVSDGGKYQYLSFLRCYRHILLWRNLQPPSLHSKSKVYVTAFSILAFVFPFTVEPLLRLLVLNHWHTVLVFVLHFIYVNHIFWPDYPSSLKNESPDSSGMLVPINQIIWHNIQQDCNVRIIFAKKTVIHWALAFVTGRCGIQVIHD
jgi:hypothetical protein